jgi:hypothetical protein
MRPILDGQFDEPRRVDPALLKAVARARCWFDEVASGHVRSLVEIARRGPSEALRTLLARLALLAPNIVAGVTEDHTFGGTIYLQMLMDNRASTADVVE